MNFLSGQKVQQAVAAERKNHYIVNIMMTAVLAIIFLVTLFGGVNVDVGSVIKGDGNEKIIHVSMFQVLDLAFSANMKKEDAVVYVKNANKVLREKYGVQEFALEYEDTSDTGPFNNLNIFSTLIGDGPGQLTEKQARQFNILKYKYAYTLAISDVNDEGHQISWAGSRVISMAGQSILLMLPQVALLIITLIMLIFSIISLVKKRNNNKVKLSFMLMGISLLVLIFFMVGFGFYTFAWSGILTIILYFLSLPVYVLIQHLMMDKKDFSLNMLIHNGVLLLGAVLALILYLCPLFTVSGLNYGWSYLYDLTLTSNIYMSVPMAYMLLSILSSLLLLPAVLLLIYILLQFYRFMSCNYQRNEPRKYFIITAVVNILIFLLVGIMSIGGGLDVSSIPLYVTLKPAVVIIEPLVLAGIVVFEYLYKAKPIKKELVIR